MHTEDSNIIALATDTPPSEECAIPVLDLNDIPELANFIATRVVAPAAEEN